MREISNKQKNINFKNRANSKNPNTKDKLFLFIAFVFPVLLYIQTLGFGLTSFDDDQILTKNINFLNDLKNIPRAFLTNAFIGRPSMFYRPLQTITFMMDVKISGVANPWMFHLTNTLLIGLVSASLFLFLRKLDLPPRFSFMATLVYCCHPLFVSTVSWIPSRGELLLAVFSILSFVFLIDYLKNNNPVYLILHWIFLIIDLFCKETAAFLPFVFIIYLIVFNNKPGIRKKLIFFTSLYFLSGLFWFIFRTMAISGQSIVNHVPVSKAIISNLRVFPESFSKFFIPIDMAPIPGFTVFKTLTGIILFFLLIYFLIKDLKNNKEMKIFCLSWFLIFMLPPMFYKNQAYDYLDHRFFLPFIGILPFSLFMIPKKLTLNNDLKKIAFTPAVAILLALSIISFFKSLEFKNPVVFYDSAIEKNPNSSLSLVNRGFRFHNSGNYKRAIEDYDKAIEINPEYATAFLNRGLSYYSLKNLKRSLEDNNMAISLDKNNFQAHYNRGIVFSNLKMYKKATDDFNLTIRIEPNNSKLFYARAIVNSDSGLTDKAIEDYSRAITLRKNFPDAYNNRGILYLKQGKNDEAISDFKTAINLDKNYIMAYKNLGRAFIIIEKFPIAINTLSEAISLSPNDWELYLSRAFSFYSNGEKEKACQDWHIVKKIGNDAADQYIRDYCK